MEKNRKIKKIEGLQKITKCISQYQAIFVLKNNNIKPTEMWDLKCRIRNNNAGECFIEKNTIMKIGVKNHGIYDYIDGLLNGPNIFVFITENQITDVAKSICEFSKETSKVELLGGCLFTENKKQSFSKLDIEKISKLPSKNEIRAQILGVIQAPQLKLISVMRASKRDIICVINNFLIKRNT
ncbi:50S ribosomal protein L10 [Lyticum sinuosum]|uniref:Large ribosomal subunit protein uL10 n=1 Tax=Lyticum sinuosum TaxID=1332059 RepID=A0AAE4VK06_9RICK|nr:50S ribosomal protein L10 [Lyticum sinuosum]MDZ5760940.1 50S ribosomal protein L10 [Lyticum sinuosum]